MLTNDTRPLYGRVMDELRAQILSGALRENALIPAKEEIAKMLGVSDMTVRRALIELTQEGWLKRVPGTGTFVRARKQKSAHAGREQENCRIAVVSNSDVAGIRGSLFYVRLLQSMHSAADAGRAFLAIKKTTEPYSEFAAALKAQGVAGIVLFGGVDAAVIAAVQDARIPAVLLDTAPLADGPPIDEVNHAGEAVSYQAVSELLQLGHERIGIMVTLATSYFFKQRLDGYRRALKHARIAFDPKWVIEAEPTSQAGYTATLRLLRADKKITALFSAHDELALGAMAAVRDSGLSIPGDFSIAGFGDFGLFSAPALSTVRMPLEQMGRMAIETLLRRIQNPEIPLQRTILDCEWIARGSTGLRKLETASKADR